MVIVTKRMVNRAENTHFRQEDAESFDRFAALSAVFWKQKGKPERTKLFLKGNPEAKALAKKIEARKERPPVKRKPNPFRINFKQPKFRF